jgi:hypothetical protein
MARQCERHDDEGMGTSTTPPRLEANRRPETAILLAVGTAIVIALVVGAVLANRATEFPDGSPEATAQKYLQAILDNDERTARTYLAPDVADNCDPFPRTYGLRYADTVRFAAVAVDGGHAEIELEFSFSSDYEPFEFPIDEPRHSPGEAHLVLEQRTDGWVVVGASWISDVCRER